MQNPDQAWILYKTDKTGLIWTICDLTDLLYEMTQASFNLDIYHENLILLRLCLAYAIGFAKPIQTIQELKYNLLLYIKRTV